MKLIKIIIVILLFSLHSIAQQGQNGIFYNPESKADTIPRLEIISEYSDGSIYLRWATTEAVSWYENSFSGYKLYRIEVDENKGIPIMETIDSFMIKAWPKAKFSSYIDSTNENILIAAQCLYGDWEQSQDFVATKDELTNRYSFAMFAADINWNTALSLGLAFEDKNIKKGKTYFYKIEPIDTSTVLREAYLSINAKEMKKAIPEISNTIESENSITIQWDKEKHKDFFSGFYIEKSEDGKIYTRLNKRPIIGGESREFPSDIISFIDSVKNYIQYNYRIIGITAFGRLSSPSNGVIAMGRDKTPPSIPVKISINCDNTTKTVNIDWDAVESGDLQNYAVYRSNKSDGEYKIVSKPLIRKNTLHYSEKSPDVNKYFYYKISAIDTAGNYSTSLPQIAVFRDTIAPESPKGLQGTIDSMGIVQLSWLPNSEDDLAGYHVYMSNSLSHIFVKISSNTLSSNTFEDTITLKTFTENIYYKITAIDFHSHFSEFSETINLKKPDIIPPFPPSIKKYNYNQNEGTITISWSPSKSSDLDYHILYKFNNGKWEEIKKFNKNENKFTDKNTEPGKAYKYKIIAVDDDGLRSNSKAFVVIKTTDKRLPSTPEITVCNYKNEKSIRIEWTPTSDKKHKNYIVYRSINDQAFSVIARIKDSSYEDTGVSRNKKYSYAIKQIWEDGKKSKMSQVVHPK